MEQSDFEKRIEDLSLRCSRTGSITLSSFLTPTESFSISGRIFNGIRPLLLGGYENAERKVAFFLPEWESEENLDLAKYLAALEIKSYFGAPGHRDYMGAILGLGIERDRIGDILVSDDTAYIICIRSVASLILNELDKVGHCGVKVSSIPLSAVPEPEIPVRSVSFTVKSLRLDAVAGDMFGISRTSAAEFIRLGAVTLNYSICEKTDAPVSEGDVISIRGKGKGRIREIGGRSKKDRIFVTAEIRI